MRCAVVLIVTLALSSAVAGCGERATAARVERESHEMSNQLARDLALIRRARILFHHHSVGANVLAGIEDWERETGGERLAIVTLDEAAASQQRPALLHGGGGHNGAPKSKMDAFAGAFREGTHPKPQLAFMKLCYVDFAPDTDVADLFAHYRRTMETVKRENPSVRFAHVTVPLFRRPSDPKSVVRRLLGLEVWEDAANVKRAEYNARLRETFSTDPVFDLARVEATDLQGNAVEFEQNGVRHPSLHPGYTEDGGHLNDAGRRVAGAEAIRFMADALRGRGESR